MPNFVAGLCKVTKAGLDAPYEGEELFASDETEAVSKAREWLASCDRELKEETWLQVLIDGRAILSEKVSE